MGKGHRLAQADEGSEAILRPNNAGTVERLETGFQSMGHALGKSRRFIGIFRIGTTTLSGKAVRELAPDDVVHRKPIHREQGLLLPTCQPPMLAASKARVWRTASSSQLFWARMTDQPRPMLFSFSFGPFGPFGPPM
jgi:hypothetical protein